GNLRDKNRCPALNCISACLVICFTASEVMTDFLLAEIAEPDTRPGQANPGSISPCHGHRGQNLMKLAGQRLQHLLCVERIFRLAKNSAVRYYRCICSQNREICPA